MKAIDGSNNNATDPDAARDNSTAIANDYLAYMTNETGPRHNPEIESESDSDSDPESGSLVSVDDESGGAKTGRFALFSSPRPSPTKPVTNEEEELASLFAVATSLSQPEDIPMLPPPPPPPRVSSPTKTQQLRPSLSRQVGFLLNMCSSRPLPPPPTPPKITLKPFGLTTGERRALRAVTPRLLPVNRRTEQFVIASKGFFPSYYDYHAYGTPRRPSEFGTLEPPYTTHAFVSLRGIGRKMPAAFWIARDRATGDRHWLWHRNGHRSSLRVENRNQLNAWVSQNNVALNQRETEFQTRTSGRRGGNIRSMDGGTAPVRKMGRDFMKWGMMLQNKRSARIGIQLPARLCDQKLFSLFVGSSEEGILPNDIIPTYLSEAGHWCLCTKRGGNWQPVNNKIGLRRVGGEWPGVARLWEQVDNQTPEPVNIGDHEHFVDTTDRQHFLNAGKHQEAQGQATTSPNEPAQPEPHHEQSISKSESVQEDTVTEELMIGVDRNFPDTHQVEVHPRCNLSPEVEATATSAGTIKLDGASAGRLGDRSTPPTRMPSGPSDESEETRRCMREMTPEPEIHLPTDTCNQAQKSDGTNLVDGLQEPNRHYAQTPINIDTTELGGDDFYDEYPYDLTIPNDHDDDGDTVIGDESQYDISDDFDQSQKIVRIARRFRGEEHLRTVLGRRYYWRALAAEYGHGMAMNCSLADFGD